jgi:hypothetical protein
VFFCTDALAPSMRELVPQFEKATGHSVRTTVANAGTIAARLQQGEPADLAIVLSPAWERLKQDGRIDPATRRPIRLRPARGRGDASTSAPMARPTGAAHVEAAPMKKPKKPDTNWDRCRARSMVWR